MTKKLWQQQTLTIECDQKIWQQPTLPIEHEQIKYN